MVIIRIIALSHYIGDSHPAGNATSGQVHRVLSQSKSRSSYGGVTEEVTDQLVYKLQLLLEWSRQRDTAQTLKKKKPTER